MSVVSDPVRPHRRQPSRLPFLGFSRQEYGVGCHFFLYTELKETSLNPWGNTVQVILCWWHLVLPWANQWVFLMEIYLLNFVNETMYFLWNLPLFKMVPPENNFLSFLKPWADIGSTNQYSCLLFYGERVGWGGGDDTPSAILSQKCILWGRGLVKLLQPWGVSLIWLIAF